MYNTCTHVSVLYDHWCVESSNAVEWVGLKTVGISSQQKFYLHVQKVQAYIHSISVNSHLVQNRLKIDVTPIIAYVGYTHLLARATVA